MEKFPVLGTTHFFTQPPIHHPPSTHPPIHPPQKVVVLKITSIYAPGVVLKITSICAPGVEQEHRWGRNKCELVTLVWVGGREVGRSWSCCAVSFCFCFCFFPVCLCPRLRVCKCMSCLGFLLL